MLNRYKVTMEPGCRTRHGPSRRASCRKLVRRFCSPECQSLLTSVPIWEKAVRAPFLYRLVPPFIGFYRLLSLRTKKVFFEIGRAQCVLRKAAKWVENCVPKRKTVQILSPSVGKCRLLSPSVASPRGSLVRGVGRREVRNFGKAPNSKDQAPASAQATNEPPQDGSLWSSESLLPFRSASPRPIQAGRLCYPFPHGC
jgi:hypothetical protein